MALKKIRQDGLDIYHREENANWILGLACGLLIAGAYAIGLTANVLILIIVPFLIVPIFFAGHCAFLAIQANEKITFMKALSYFLLYFKNPFSSSFSFMKSLFKCLLIFLLSFIVFAPMSYAITNAGNPVGMNGLVTELNNLLQQGSYTIQELNEILEKYWDVVTSISYITLLPTAFLTMLGFVFFISGNSLSVYYRLSCPLKDANLMSVIHKIVISKKRKEFFKLYFGLNWPMYVLLTIGFGGGIVLSLYFAKDAAFAAILSVSFAFVAVSFYLPFYFPNMQALYEYFAPLYHGATIEAANQMSGRTRQTTELKQDNETRSEIIDIETNKEDNNERND